MTDQIQDQDLELDIENNEVEIEEAQAHDPKNAETQSVASVKSAEGAGKTAKKRKGDKAGGDAMQKASAGDPDVKSNCIDERCGCTAKRSIRFLRRFECIGF